MRNGMTALIAGFVFALGAWSEVSMEVKPYAGWPNSVHLSNEKVQLIVTTDVGPRVIYFGFPGGPNLMKEFDDQAGETGGDEWRIYGGHRLWHAPEAAPRTYAPDNDPVEYEWDGTSLRLQQEAEPSTGIAKEIVIELDADDPHVTVTHRLINRNLWDIRLAPWALTVMAPGGFAIFPQEEYRPHPEYLLPARPLVLWHYTDMSDPRWTWGEKYILLRQDEDATTKQKAGMLNTKGWAAYHLDGNLFVKMYPYVEGVEYPDYGSNTEAFTDSSMLEVETLGPLTNLAANGGGIELVEEWFLFPLVVEDNVEDVDEKLPVLIERIDEHLSGEGKSR